MNKVELRANRKLDHLKLSLEEVGNNLSNWFENVILVHQALPELNFDEIDLTCNWLGKNLAAPILINAITGGAKATKQINASLAKVAKKYGLAMAVGSQTSGIEDGSIQETYQVAREENPDGLLLANVSALSTVEEVFQAVEMIQADGVQLHLNVLQELLMPEGDREFKSLLDNIAEIVKQSPVPVIIKEVGSGISKEVALKLYNKGITNIDVGGCGGTNFAAIEALRHRPPRSNIFNTWGIPTAASLLEVKSLNLPVHITATGGIKTGLEVCKALRLGADIVGIAGYCLKILLRHGESQLSEELDHIINDLKIAMLLCGAKNTTQLSRVPVVYTGDLLCWIKQRNLTID